jgi:hypothetical protein
MSTLTIPSAEVFDCAIAVALVSRKQATQIFSIIGALPLVLSLSAERRNNPPRDPNAR